MSLYKVVLNLLFHEFLMIYRSRFDLLNPILFFILIVTLFPITMSSDPNTLGHLAPGIIWIAILFSAMLSFENMFQLDFDDGSLEQFILNPYPLSLLIISKIFSHWLSNCLPLIVLSIPLGFVLYLSKSSLFVLILTLLLGTPSLYLIGAIGAALILGLRQKGFLLVLLVVPLYIPILIFSITAVSDAGVNMPVTSQLAFLSAILTLCLSFAPLAIGSALRISNE